ncbi:MAG: GNAT family N-acetyltransferase [Methanomassiliicoccus sp.]|nr:GNAT family N-acetyltransferase [Methanomassiliicoccus sp.]
MSMYVRKEKQVTLRSMNAQDIEEVREVGQVAWSDLAMHDLGRRFKYPKRSEKIIEAYLAADPDGCIVAEADGKIVGSGFCHTWGKVGWTGPLEVLPMYQDHGVGRKLLGACESQLLERGCTVIGLETMCHLAKNLHFYLSSGYRPGQSTLIMEKVLRHEKDPLDDVREVTIDDIDAGLATVSRLSEKINPQLDYASEAGSILRRRLGNVYVMDEGSGPLGCALLHTYQRGEEATYSSVKALLVDPEAPDPLSVLDRLMARCERTSLEGGKSKLLTRFATADTRMYDQMITRAYVLKGMNLRMLKHGEYDERGRGSITSWAG